MGQVIAACRCGAVLPGRRACHCTACHRSFGGAVGFERHRVGGRCVPPEEVGLVVGRHGLWVWPATEGVAKRRRLGVGPALATPGESDG